MQDIYKKYYTILEAIDTLMQEIISSHNVLKQHREHMNKLQSKRIMNTKAGILN